MPRPTDEQFNTAIFWLRSNEGDAYESGACAAVAKWIELELRDRALKEVARKAGVPIRRARRMIAKATAAKIAAEIPVKKIR